LLATQRPGEAAILNADDEASRAFEGSVRGQLHRFSTQHEVDPGVFVRAGSIVLRIDGEEESVLRADELPVPGQHNLENALAAALASRLAGCSPAQIARGLRAYKALPHRLEFVASFDGVAFYNDSKATNLDATVRALRSFPPGTVHLILGGRDKGADWRGFAGLAAERAARVLLVGEAAETIRRELGTAVPMADCGTVRTAVRSGFEAAAPGHVVLLAPGCATFDQYKNFEQRGEDFKRAVSALFPEGEHRA
jgi:UDP-N-acetylmuramoylalanine--D-glutamate ligase